MTVGILDYSAGGNIFSIQKAITILGAKVKIIKEIKDIDKLIIPGVGAYSEGSKGILDLKNEIEEFSKNNSVLGICLGMQLLAQKGFEYGEHPGLGLINGECVKINTNRALPHLGWGKTRPIRDSVLLSNIENQSFYFMHSFEVINFTDSVALSNYGSHNFVSVIEKENIYGVQFHPEKSRNAGLQLLKNFISLD